MAKNKVISNWDLVPIVLDVPYVSMLLGICPETARRYVEQGKIRGTKVGKGWVVLKADLMEFLGAKEEKSQEVTRYINGTLVTLPDEWRRVFSEAVADFFITQLGVVPVMEGGKK